MNIVLSDKGLHNKFQPLSFTRSIADYRVGILTIIEKWEKLIGYTHGIISEDYLQYKYNCDLNPQTIIIPSNVIPNKELIDALESLTNETLIYNGKAIAYKLQDNNPEIIPNKTIDFQNNLTILNSNTDVFSLNGECLISDFELLTQGRKSANLSSTNTVFGNYPVFVEEDTFVECTTINTQNGPVYIGKNAKIMEGSHIRGPFAICENSELKMGTKIYGPTTIGPGCKVGGEINNSVFFAFSNKAHDGFLGNSVIGEWCNIGADSNNSNLKNNYAIVKLWDYNTGRFLSTGLQFCGLIMGDHSKCGINTMFNTGTVIGVSANIFGSGFPRNFVPSFSWGGHAGLSEYKLNTAFDVMTKVMARRGKELIDEEKQMFEDIFTQTAQYRKF
ncbi:MAG: glucose-1-phosphate thymidylyltransferase [Marinilabiliales bacterium]|nr:MAG: glucose-1-phosphate thymidylyltransferase [Marinilabiliales bacterium]